MLVSRKVISLADALEVKEIRNTCRDYMTHHTAYITAAEQIKFWRTLNKTTHTLYLYYETEYSNKEPIGFGMIRLESHGIHMLTLGLKPEWRHKRYGSQIYKHLAENCPDDIYAEIRTDNDTSIYAARKAGFDIYQHGTDKITLVRKKK